MRGLSCRAALGGMLGTVFGWIPAVFVAASIAARSNGFGPFWGPFFVVWAAAVVLGAFVAAGIGYAVGRWADDR